MFSPIAHAEEEEMWSFKAVSFYSHSNIGNFKHHPSHGCQNNGVKFREDLGLCKRSKNTRKSVGC